MLMQCNFLNSHWFDNGLVEHAVVSEMANTTRETPYDLIVIIGLHSSVLTTNPHEIYLALMASMNNSNVSSKNGTAKQEGSETV